MVESYNFGQNVSTLALEHETFVKRWALDVVTTVHIAIAAYALNTKLSTIVNLWNQKGTFFVSFIGLIIGQIVIISQPETRTQIAICLI